MKNGRLTRQTALIQAYTPSPSGRRAVVCERSEHYKCVEGSIKNTHVLSSQAVQDKNQTRVVIARRQRTADEATQLIVIQTNDNRFGLNG